MLTTRKLLISLSKNLSVKAVLATESGFLPQRCHNFCRSRLRILEIIAPSLQQFFMSRRRGLGAGVVGSEIWSISLQILWNRGRPQQFISPLQSSAASVGDFRV
jgi:hypothetical protein